MSTTILPIVLGTVLAFVVGSVYYAVFGSRVVGARAAKVPAGGPEPEPMRPSPKLMVVELLRCLVLAAGYEALVVWTGVTSVGGGLLLGVVLFVMFPVVLWSGAVVHEGEPWLLAVIHGGDWLVKMLLMGALLGALA